MGAALNNGSKANPEDIGADKPQQQHLSSSGSFNKVFFVLLGDGTLVRWRLERVRVQSSSRRLSQTLTLDSMAVQRLPPMHNVSASYNICEVRLPMSNSSIRPCWPTCSISGTPRTRE